MAKRNGSTATPRTKGDQLISAESEAIELSTLFDAIRAQAVVLMDEESAVVDKEHLLIAVQALSESGSRKASALASKVAEVRIQSAG